jgi:hypothetical protein
MNSLEVTSFFYLKEFLEINGYMDPGTKLYLFAGAMAGVIGLMVGNPLDVIRTVQLTSKYNLGVFKTGLKILKYDGFLGLYRGYTANVYRVAGWNSINFTCYSLLEYHYSKWKREKARQNVY